MDVTSVFVDHSTSREEYGDGHKHKLIDYHITFTVSPCIPDTNWDQRGLSYLRIGVLNSGAELIRSICHRIVTYSTVYPEILATFSIIWQFGAQDQNRQIPITKFTYTYLLCFVLAVQPPNLKSVNIKLQPDRSCTRAKFNDHQYFWIQYLVPVTCVHDSGSGLEGLPQYILHHTNPISMVTQIEETQTRL